MGSISFMNWVHLLLLYSGAWWNHTLCPYWIGFTFDINSVHLLLLYSDAWWNHTLFLHWMGFISFINWDHLLLLYSGAWWNHRTTTLRFILSTEDQSSWRARRNQCSAGTWRKQPMENRTKQNNRGYSLKKIPKPHPKTPHESNPIALCAQIFGARYIT